MTDKRLDAFLALTIVYGFFGIVGVLLFHEVPQGSKDILGPLIGVIGAGVGTIVGYRWGSSSGSQKKTELLSDMTGSGDGSTVTTKTTATIDKTTTVKPEPTKE